MFIFVLSFATKIYKNINIQQPISLNLIFLNITKKFLNATVKNLFEEYSTIKKYFKYSTLQKYMYKCLIRFEK